MRLHTLLPRLAAAPTFEKVLADLASGRAVLSAITPARPFALAALHSQLRRPVVAITSRPSEARVLANELRAWAADPDLILLFPETDALPYDRLPNDPDKLAERLGTLERLAGLNPDGAAPLVVFQGAENYITPSWYATKRETGKVVPTWNYAMVQVRGKATVIEDFDWLRRQIGALTGDHQGGRPQPWAVGDAPETFIAAQLKGIVDAIGR